jgi:hypothetical protein
MKKYLIIAAVLVLGGIVYGYYQYMRPMANISDVDPDYVMSADSLYMHFDENENDANQKYLGKIIEIKGKVRDMTTGNKGELNLMLASESDFFGINCEIRGDQDKLYDKYKIGDSILIRGECTGILSDVVMTRCVIVPRQKT